ncbi:hypothetical protein [Allorhizocola rhizosphaerae]|nr:hypothetical protein [Allorhizocola rhizosphaerae]
MEDRLVLRAALERMPSRQATGDPVELAVPEDTPIAQANDID